MWARGVCEGVCVEIVDIRVLLLLLPLLSVWMMRFFSTLDSGLQVRAHLALCVCQDAEVLGFGFASAVW